MLGEDLRAWIVAARFALSLLARQRFLPRVSNRAKTTCSVAGRRSSTIPSDRANLRAIERCDARRRASR